MNIFIMGAGQVGSHLARILNDEGHDVTVIEIDPERVQEIDDQLDVRVVTGSGTSSILLRELQVETADIFVATSGHDEANLVAASLAKKLGARKTVARINQHAYYQDAMELATAFHVDRILSPQELTARQVVSLLEHPGIVTLDDFAGGLVHAFSFQMDDSPWLDTPISRLQLPEHTLIGLINREGESIIPRGDDQIRKGDFVTFIGKSHKVQAFEDLLKKKMTRQHAVTIAGASSVGLFIAQKLEKHRFTVILVEKDIARCEEASRLLLKAEVINADATSMDALKRERLETSYVFIAATDKDDRNILAALLAKELGIPHCMAVVRQPDFTVLTSRLGVDHTLIPRVIFGSHILDMTVSAECLARSVLKKELAEIMEFVVRDGSRVCGQMLSAAGFPRGALMAAIVRSNKVFIPIGKDIILPRDRVVMIAKKSMVPEVIRMFAST